MVKKFERILGEANDDEDEVAFEWRRLPDQDFFAIDSETNTIALNSLYRASVLYGTKGSSGDAPVVKTLLMLLCKDDMSRVNKVKKHDQQMRTFNWLLVEAARSQW